MYPATSTIETLEQLLSILWPIVTASALIAAFIAWHTNKLTRSTQKRIESKLAAMPPTPAGPAAMLPRNAPSELPVKTSTLPTFEIDRTRFADFYHPNSNKNLSP